MILSTHAIVGGAIASLFPSHLALVVAAGFAPHTTRVATGVAIGLQ
jgi:hypothetical protein